MFNLGSKVRGNLYIYWNSTSVSHELTEAVITIIRVAQDQACKKSYMNEEGTHEALPINEILLINDNWLEEDDYFI